MMVEYDGILKAVRSLEAARDEIELYGRKDVAYWNLRDAILHANMVSDVLLDEMDEEEGDE